MLKQRHFIELLINDINLCPINVYFLILDNNQITPNIQMVFTKENVSIRCNSISFTLWIHRVNDSVAIIPTNSSEIEMINVTKDNAGYYDCWGKTIDGYHFVAESKLVVSCNNIIIVLVY